MSEVDTTVRVGALELTTPVLTASGCFGYGTEYAGLCDVEKIGGLCTKGLSLAPRPGNPPPRICETKAGMLNAIGLENVGVEAFVRDKVPLLEGLDTRVVANLFGVTVGEYAELCRRLEGVARVDAVELNISCPNVKHGGVEFGTDPLMAAEVTRAARAATTKPLWVKLSPNAGDRIAEVARAVAGEGADALTLVNTMSAMEVDVETRRPVLANRTGGLSGPALKPIALRMVDLVHRAVETPIVGIGGIVTGRDAVQFLLAGASAVQVGTVCFADPRAPERIGSEISEIASELGVARVADLVGALEK